MIFFPAGVEYKTEQELMLLFLYYSEELTNSKSFDTHQLPVHNAVSLCSEAQATYSVLKSQHSLDAYYTKYIPIIIDELLVAIHDDKLLKKSLGLRLESIISGLKDAAKTPSTLVRWLDQVRQSCSVSEYIDMHKKEIILCIEGNKDKTELMKLTKCLWTAINNYGYSIEFISEELRRFIYSNKHQFNIDLIKDFLDKFDFKSKPIEIYAIVDNYVWDYFCNLKVGFEKSIKIEPLEHEFFKEKINTHAALNIFYQKYVRLNNRHSHNKIKMIKFSCNSYEQYRALSSLVKIFEQLNDILSCFNHGTYQKHIFDCLYIDGDRIKPVKPYKKLRHRPFIDKGVIDKRILLLFRPKNIANNALKSLFTSLSLHSDAVSSRNETLMLRTLWSATETLFATNNPTSERENVIYSILHVVQKTYLLKILRGNYLQLTQAIKDKNFWHDEMKIENFMDYVEFFVKTGKDTPDFKKIYTRLSSNPLLRSRTYQLKKKLLTPKHILELLDEHNRKIYWQLNRIYRTRNLSTHAGIEMPHTSQLLSNLHNYFDYIINYIFCKMENGNYIASIQSVVLEAKTDNMIHRELLKKETEINLTNYKHCLFGPDLNLLKYDFEYYL